MSDRTTFYLDDEVCNYIRTCVDNKSDFVNFLLREAMEDGIEEGDEWETARVRARVFRMQLNVLEKEIMELERQRDIIEGILDEYDDGNGDGEPLWSVSIDDVTKRNQANWNK